VCIVRNVISGNRLDPPVSCEAKRGDACARHAVRVQLRKQDTHGGHASRMPNASRRASSPDASILGATPPTAAVNSPATSSKQHALALALARSAGKTMTVAKNLSESVTPT